MKNYVQPGESLTIPAPSNLTSGQGLIFGVSFGVVAATVLSGQLVTVQISGVYDLPKVAEQTPAIGALLYWVAANSHVTTTVGSNVKIGICAAVPGAGDATIRVRLNGSF